MSLLLLFGGGAPAKQLSSLAESGVTITDSMTLAPENMLSAVAEGVLTIAADLTGQNSTNLTAVAEGELTITADLTAERPPLEGEVPRRFYIWVYNLAGVKVDVIA